MSEQHSPGEASATTLENTQSDGRLAARIADTEVQYHHFSSERLRAWSEAREAGWSFARIAEAAGVERTTVFYAIRRADERSEKARSDGLKRAKGEERGDV